MKNCLIALFAGLISATTCVQAQIPCLTEHRPVIFVHGFLGSGDTWARQIQRFKANGYCKDRLFVFDWNSMGSFQKADKLLHSFIDSVLRLTGATQVDLVGHSAGAMISYKYLKDSLHATKIAHYVHIAGIRLEKKAGNAGQIPTMAISGKADKVIQRFAANNVDIDLELDSLDHLALATDAASFSAMFRFFNANREALFTEPILPASGHPLVGGRIVQMGSNEPLIKDSLWVFQWDIEKGNRRTNSPFKSFITDSNGRFPSFVNTGNSGLEFIIRPATGRSITYFIGPQDGDNEHIYLRCLPQLGLVAQILKDIPNVNEASALAIFSENHAMIAGRDSLFINEKLLSTSLNMPAEKTAIACFLYDNGDGISSMQPNSDMQAGAFITGIDCLIPADNNKTILLRLNDRQMRIPCRPSSSTIMVAVFH